MIRNIVYILSFALFAIFFYIIILFDINDHKYSLEKIISEQANIEFKILGNLSLDLGVNTKIKAKLLSIKKIIFYYWSLKNLMLLYHYQKF